MKHTIQNEYLSVGAQENGVELVSMIELSINKEYMWQANDPEYWARHSSILFPVIGACNNGEIKVAGKSHPMTKHGLVRNSDFQLEEKTSDEMSFTLSSSDQTKIHYPFDWTLKIRYRLIGKTLSITYKVFNDGDVDLPYSIGAHPAFNCPMDEGLQRSDYSLVFDQEETQYSPQIDPEGLISSKTVNIMNQSKTITIEDDLFSEDALILTNLNSSKVSLESIGGSSLTFSFKGFTHLGIWASPGNAPFVCIEPWCGIADPVGYQGEIYTKPGILRLAPNSVSEHTHIISL